ncbi:hypothetical protein J2T13_003466 [Paenibacillus sp. DS2015]|uniref:transcription initiation factor TFIID n=1 Tax=Paenibacillus sp. DS2015 TaxID=3373917 RepID=UPI003D19FF7C
MREILQRFATEYASAEDKLNGRDDDQSSIHYPTVYLFIGDKVADAIEPIMSIHDKKWDNSAGVMYVHMATEGGKVTYMDTKAQSRIDRFELPSVIDTAQSTSLRKDLYTSLYKNEQYLLGLNRMFRQVSHNIADYGLMYSSFDRIHLSFITRVDDPLNVFIPEISMLAESIFSQSFKSVQMDLYGLISEREVESFGYTHSVGVAFLRELEYMQQSDYTFSAPLHVTEDGISIAVTHPPSPLFDLVYLLSDKNERGISSVGDMQDNYEIICQVSLLKNRKQKEAQHHSGGNYSYNNMSFKNNMMSESGRQGYVSAGLSKVKRPNQSIALTVLYHFYRQMMLRMKNGASLQSKEKLAFFGIDPRAVLACVDALMPDEGKIEEMTGIMSHQVSFSSLKRMTLREAEQALYGDGCDVYFHTNYVREITVRLEGVHVGTDLGQKVKKHMLEQPQIGFFQVAEWSDELNSEGVIQELRATIRELMSQVESAKVELAQYYQELVEEQSFPRVPLMDKHNLRHFMRYFVETVYRRKLGIVRLETELTLLRRYEIELTRMHEHYKRQVEKMESLEDTLRKAAVESINRADDYIGQNILEYYERVTEGIIREIEAKRGPSVFFEDRYMGSVTELLDAGLDHLVERLIEICRNNLLTAEPFAQTFEEELLRRANVTIDYSNKQVLSKDELFKKLYRTLEDHAAINVRLLDYTHEHRYEEKYFFGDAESEFIRYSLGADETSRIYKLGYVHERRSSGVEKLNLMGGFHVEDLMYYRNGKIYYESYVQNGYEFHGVDPVMLPELR